MSHYSDPNHALLNRIANAVERVAVALEANNASQRKVEAMSKAGADLIEQLREHHLHSRDPRSWGETLIKNFEDANKLP